MTTRCADWRRLPPSVTGPLVAAEVQSWRDALTWDVSEAWSVIEPARASGRLPGFVTKDPSGRVTGWTCFFPHRGALHVVALVAASAADTGALVEAVLSSPEAASAGRVIVSVREAAPSLRQALAACGLRTATYRYLGADLDERPASRLVSRPWRPTDAEAAARLCERAYRDADDVRAFAPEGTPDEWREYVANLITTPDCGRFLAQASFVIPASEPGEIDGLVMTSRLGPGTAHIAQVAVDPGVRGLGWGRELVAAALSSAAAEGLARATLLVSTANERAAAIYEAEGFRQEAAFVVADARQPRRLKSAALATGGASTRR